MKESKRWVGVGAKLLEDARLAVRSDGSVPFGWAAKWAREQGVEATTVHAYLAKMREFKQLPPLTGPRHVQHTKTLNDKHLEMECILVTEPDVTNAELARRLDMTLDEVSFQRGHAMAAIRANSEPPFNEVIAMKKRQAEIRAEKEAWHAKHGERGSNARPLIVCDDPMWPAQRRRGARYAQ